MLSQDCFRRPVIELSVTSHDASGSMLERVSRGKIFREHDEPNLALVTMDKNRMVTWVQKDLQRHCNRFRRNDHRFILVSGDGHLEMLNATSPHKLDIFQRINFGDKSPDFYQISLIETVIGCMYRSYKILFNPKDDRCSKLPALGKLLR